MQIFIIYILTGALSDFLHDSEIQAGLGITNN
jgi:hypothetical protein